MSQEELKEKAISIKGKDYILVKDRIAYFNEAYPYGQIQTEIVRYEDGQVIVKAMVYPGFNDAGVSDSPRPRFFVGHSQAREGDGMVNKMAALENAETSAVGRALAMMGIGVIDSIASADEMVKAGVAPVRKAYDAEDFDREINNLPAHDFAGEEQAMKEATDEALATATNEHHEEVVEDICPEHKAKMFLKKGPYGEFYSHGKQLDNGKWMNCNGKGYK